MKEDELNKRMEYDHIVLDIEFLLISVVQGLALVFLAERTVDVISNFEFQYWPYVVSGFFFILIFWSQAIIHAVSFIKWPMNLVHSFLYFLVAYMEVLTFNQIKDPMHWFGMTFVFFLFAAVLYIFDLKMILNAKKEFEDNPARKELYKHILHGQRFEMTILVPAGLLFNATVFLLINFNHQLFIDQKYHVILGALQALFGLLFLINSLISFKKRTKLITATFYIL